MNENTFPVCKLDTIIQFCRTDLLNAQEAKQFSKSDITPNPKPDVVQRLYMRLLQVVYGYKPECLYMMPLSENVPYPTLHEGVTPIMNLYLRMCQFLPHCHVYDFSLNDLLSPKLKQTINILSGIMNFMRFRNHRAEHTAAHQHNFRADMDRLQSCTKGIMEAEKKIEKLMTIPPEQQAEARELDRALSELNATTVHESQEVNTINLQIAEWKTQIAEKTQSLSQKKLDVATLKEDIVKLKSQIVESPEELKSEMKRMKENVKAIKLSKEHADEKLVELQINLQAVMQGKAEIQLTYKLLQDLQASMNKTNQRQEEVGPLTLMYQSPFQKELKAVSTEEGQLKRALAMKLDKESKQHIRRQKKKEMKDQHFQSIVGQYDRVHLKREEVVEQIQQINSDTEQFKAKMQNLKDICNQDTDKAQALYDHVITMLDQFHKRIENYVVEESADIHKMKSNF
uniref:Kinetochore protein Nuf2 N-terminal domain-containing protein n=1 Tax=Denticeps clupeoides TaxID=299321 RepID=A0AAY4DIY1_9TELE